MVFRNDNHGVLFEKEIRYHKGCSRKFAAALFLLTADTRLWHQAENHIGTNEIDIAAIKPRHLDGMSYVCYMLAKDIVTGSRTVAQTELADPSLMSPRYFMVIQTAITNWWKLQNLSLAMWAESHIGAGTVLGAELSGAPASSAGARISAGT